MTEANHSWLAIAHLVRPQGRKGELLSELWTEFPQRFDGQPRVFLAKPGFQGDPEQARIAIVTSFWLPKGKQQGRVVLGLDISTSISDAEQLAGLDVLVPLAERRALEGDAAYIHDLVGCTVLDRGEAIGTLFDLLSINPSPPESGVESIVAEAAPVLVVIGQDKIEYLIPFARAYLRSVDLHRREIDMQLPEALLEIYRPAAGAGQKRYPKPTESTG